MECSQFYDLTIKIKLYQSYLKHTSTTFYWQTEEKESYLSETKKLNYLKDGSLNLKD